MSLRLFGKAALFVAIVLGPLSGCGNPPSIVGNWTSATALGVNLQQAWSLKFTADGRFELRLVNTSTATSGRGAGCVDTIVANGTYTASEPDLTVTAQSGSTTYDHCLNSAENTATSNFPPASLMMLSTDFTGPFSVTADELTLSPPESGFGPGVLTRN